MAGLINGINYYYNTYAINKTGRYTYNPMADLIRISAASKVYSQNFTQSYDSGLSDYFNVLTKNTYLMKSVTSSMETSNLDSSFNKRAVTASDSAVTGTATPKAEMKDYTVNVQSLAQKQVNTGAKLISSDWADNVGRNTISVKFDNGTTRNISFLVGNTDTKKTSLDKMAKAINNAGIGLTANVVNDSKNGTSYLSIEGKTGTKNAFAMQDVEGSALAKTNANNTTALAKDALLAVNGKQYTSENNSLKLDNGNLSIGFTKAEGMDIKVSVGNDKNAAKKNIKDLVESYNNLIGFSAKYESNFPGAATMSNELGAIVKAKKEDLAEIGITVNRDNTLEIDDRKLDKSMNENFNKVRNTIAGYGGLGDKLDKKADEILTKEYKYAKPMELSPNYNDLGSYMNQYGSMSYMMSMNLGYLINTTA